MVLSFDKDGFRTRNPFGRKILRKECQMNRLEIAFGLVIFTVFAAGAASAANNPRPSGHWVSAWGTSVHVPLHFPGMPGEPPLDDKTVRMVVRPTISGTKLRIRFSNEFGTSAVTIGAAHVALADEGAKVQPKTDRLLTFDGKPSVSIPAGAPIVSDPVELSVKAFSEISISVYLPANAPVLTWHSPAQRESYLAGPGDLTAQPELPGAEHKPAWYFLSSVEVWAPASTTAILALGDSITQGTSMKPNELYTDWPDQLARRLAGQGGSEIAVVNEGIGGNRVLHDAAGVSALARFDRDVLAQSGVTTLILMEGINDIGFPRIRFAEFKNLPAPRENPFAAQKVSAEEITDGLKQIIGRARAHGMRIFGATLTPFEGTNSYDAEGEIIRLEVNKWIRSTDAYDGIFDFDALLRDPAHTSRLQEAYDSGDHIHPSPAGYKAMADSIPLLRLRGRHP
jgi:lysophospholipase L1-like esterase